MKQSNKAALLSALIFPGVGQLVLRHYLRGVSLVLIAGTAFSFVVSVVIRQAQDVLDRAMRGEIATDMSSIAAQLETGGQSSAVGNIALLVFLLCWLVGIVDAWRLGSVIDRKQAKLARQ
jgi:hypothetical protein